MVVEGEETPAVIKRLFYAVLAFWLVKKYVLPYVGGSRATTSNDEV